jgi:hypothetical protein
VERIDFPALDQPTPIGDPPTLWSVNSTIFLAALFLATVAFFVIIALVVVKNNGAVLTSLNDLGRVVGSAFGQVGISVRRVLMGIVWVVPALLIALFATALTGQLNANQTGASSTLDLFLPSASGVPDVFLNIVIGAVAIVFVILAVSIAEANLAILRDTLRILRNTGQIVWIASPVVIYGLAALNAAIIFGFGRNVGTPFKAGGTGAVSLGFLILLPLGAYLYQRFVRPNAASSGEGASTSAPVPVGARTSRGGQP